MDFELMGGERLAWSWEQLQATPAYVRRFCWDLMVIKRRAMARASKPGGGHG